jgi:hypothetical protein
MIHHVAAVLLLHCVVCASSEIHSASWTTSASAESNQTLWVFWRAVISSWTGCKEIWTSFDHLCLITCM